MPEGADSLSKDKGENLEMEHEMELRLAELTGDSLIKRWVNSEQATSVRLSIQRIHFCDFNLKKKKEGKRPCYRKENIKLFILFTLSFLCLSLNSSLWQATLWQNGKKGHVVSVSRLGFCCWLGRLQDQFCSNRVRNNSDLLMASVAGFGSL